MVFFFYSLLTNNLEETDGDVNRFLFQKFNLIVKAWFSAALWFSLHCELICSHSQRVRCACSHGVLTGEMDRCLFRKSNLMVNVLFSF